MTAFSPSAIYHSKTARTIAAFASGNMAAMLLGVVGSLVQARYVAPEDMGIFRTFSLLAGYLTFLHLGVFDGLQREIPLQIGRGSPANAERAASACLAWITFISIASVALFVALALRAAYYQEWMNFWGWLAYAPMIAMTFYGGYLGTTFRTGKQFVTLSYATVTQAIVGTLVLPLLPIMGYYGVCLRTASASITNLLLLHRWRPMKVRPRLDWRSFREVVRIGLPLTGTGYLSTALWVSVEGTLVLDWFGLRVLGLFSVAIFVRTMVVQVAANANQVVTVKAIEHYGRTNRFEDCVKLILKPMAFAITAAIPLIVAGWFVLPCAIRVLIPQYAEATFMAQLMLLVLPLVFGQLIRAIFRAAGRWIDCAISDSVGFPTFVGCSYLLYRLHFGAVSVVLGSLTGMLISLLVSCGLLRLLILRERAGLANPADNERSEVYAV
jgi:O-antigen/teichoic acid export membrane protein